MQHSSNPSSSRTLFYRITCIHRFKPRNFLSEYMITTHHSSLCIQKALFNILSNGVPQEEQRLWYLQKKKIKVLSWRRDSLHKTKDGFSVAKRDQHVRNVWKLGGRALAIRQVKRSSSSIKPALSSENQKQSRCPSDGGVFLRMISTNPHYRKHRYKTIFNSCPL